jgi:hypothetical protein
LDEEKAHIFGYALNNYIKDQFDTYIHEDYVSSYRHIYNTHISPFMSPTHIHERNSIDRNKEMVQSIIFPFYVKPLLTYGYYTHKLSTLSWYEYKKRRDTIKHLASDLLSLKRTLIHLPSSHYTDVHSFKELDIHIMRLRRIVQSYIDTECRSLAYKAGGYCIAGSLLLGGLVALANMQCHNDTCSQRVYGISLICAGLYYLHYVHFVIKLIYNTHKKPYFKHLHSIMNTLQWIESHRNPFEHGDYI